jgi:hypothetical protein
MRRREAEGRAPDADDTQADEPTEPAPDRSYEVVQDGGYYRLIGPDGAIGKGKRTEEEAWALLEGEGEDSDDDGD